MTSPAEKSSALAERSGGAAVPSAINRASRSPPELAPVACRNAATSRSICKGASITSLTCGNVCVNKPWVAARLACSVDCSFQAQALRPSNCATSSTAKPQRAGCQRGACSSSLSTLDKRLTVRARPELARSNWAKSQGERAASSQRSERVSKVTLRWSNCSASSATAGSAHTSQSSSGWAGGTKATAAALSGRRKTPLMARPVATSCGLSASPTACRCKGPASGVNSGTTRVMGRCAASSACKCPRSQALLHTATQVGPAADAAGASARCRSVESSSKRSSSTFSSTTRKRGEPGPTPLGSSTACQDNMLAGTTATTSPALAGAGSSANGTLACAASTRPSGVLA